MTHEPDAYEYTIAGEGMVYSESHPANAHVSRKTREQGQVSVGLPVVP